MARHNRHRPRGFRLWAQARTLDEALHGKGWVKGSGHVPSSPPPPKLGRSTAVVDGHRELTREMADRIEAIRITARLRQVAEWLEVDTRDDAYADLRAYANRLEQNHRLP